MSVDMKRGTHNSNYTTLTQQLVYSIMFIGPENMDIATNFIVIRTSMMIIWLYSIIRGMAANIIDIIHKSKMILNSSR